MGEASSGSRALRSEYPAAAFAIGEMGNQVAVSFVLG